MTPDVLLKAPFYFPLFIDLIYTQRSLPCLLNTVYDYSVSFNTTSSISYRSYLLVTSCASALSIHTYIHLSIRIYIYIYVYMLHVAGHTA